MNTFDGKELPEAWVKLDAMETVSENGLMEKLNEVLARALLNPLAVTRDQRPEWVLLSAAHYEALLAQHWRSLVKPSEMSLEQLSAEFDEMLAKMNTPDAKAAVDGLFAASEVQFAESVKALRKEPASPEDGA